MAKKYLWLAICGIGIIGLTSFLIVRYYMGTTHSFQADPKPTPRHQWHITIEDPHYVIPAARLIESFEQSNRLIFWGENTSKCERSTRYATDGQYSLAVNFLPGQYPNIDTYKLPRNWSSASTFNLDIYNPQNDKYWFTVRIDDHTSVNYQTRFNQEILIIPGKNHISIKVVDIGKCIKLTDVKYLVLFLSNVSQPVTLYLDNLRLT